MNQAAFPIHAVICTHGRCALLGRTLESLAAARRPANFSMVWVIENGSDEGAKAVCEQFKDRLPVRYEHLKTPGKSRAMQHGVDLVGKGLVIFLDDDVRVDPQLWMVFSEAAAEHGPDVFYGGELLIDYEAAPPAWLAPELPPSARGWRWKGPTPFIDRPCFLAANIAVFAETIQRIGGFNPDLGAGAAGNLVGEEIDVQKRLLESGCRGLYLPGAKVWHYVPRERCSVKWALARYERIYTTSGLTDTREMTGTMLRGLPVWLWRKWWRLWWKALAANLISDPAERFARKKLYYQCRGYMAGTRMRLGGGGKASQE